MRNVIRSTELIITHNEIFIYKASQVSIPNPSLYIRRTDQSRQRQERVFFTFSHKT